MRRLRGGAWGWLGVVLMSSVAWGSGPGDDVYRLVMENEPEPGYFWWDGDPDDGTQADGTPCLGSIWQPGLSAGAQPCRHRYWEVNGRRVELAAEVLIIVDDRFDEASVLVTFESTPPATTAFRIDRASLESRRDNLNQVLRNYWVATLLSDLCGDSKCPGEGDLPSIADPSIELRGLYELALRAPATQAAQVPSGLIPVIASSNLLESRIESAWDIASVARLKVKFEFAEPRGGLSVTTLNQPPTAGAISQPVSGTQPTAFTPQRSDPEGGATTLSIAWPPDYGSALASGGTITYTPDYCRAGTSPDPFVYRVVDSAGHATCATITPTVTFADDCDRDGIVDATDNCPSVFNPGQENWGTDTEGDACDQDDWTYERPVDPRRTYLRRRNDNVNDATMMPTVQTTVIDIGAEGLVPGHRIRLTRLGAFNFGGQAEDTGTGLLGVFSSNPPAILTDATVVDRLPNAIYAGLNWVTPNTHFPLDADGNPVGVTTDIPEDFFIGQVVVTVPPGARFLIVSAEDRHYSGNSDADGDFAVRIEFSQ